MIAANCQVGVLPNRAIMGYGKPCMPQQSVFNVCSTLCCAHVRREEIEYRVVVIIV